MNLSIDASHGNALDRLSKRSSSKKYWSDEFNSDWVRVEFPSDIASSGERSLHVLNRKIRYDFYTRLLDALDEKNHTVGDFWNAVTALTVFRLTSQTQFALAYTEGDTSSCYPLILDFSQLTKFSDVIVHVKSKINGTREYIQGNRWADYTKIWQEKGNSGSPAAICLSHGKTDDVHAREALEEFDALINIDASIDSLEISFRYDAAVMDMRTANSFVSVLENVAKLCVDNLEISQSQIVLATEEHLSAIELFNDTNVPFERERRIEDAFLDAARNNPNHIAIRSSSGNLTYGQFLSKASSIAAVLRSRGIGRGDVVAIVAERSSESIAGIFGVLIAGATYLPVDPNYPSSRVRYMLDDSHAKLALLGGHHLSELIQLPLIALQLSDAIVFGAAATQAGRGADLLSTDAAYIIYTSGSTGNPKGVIVEHQSVINRLQWMQNSYPLSTDDVLIQKTSISFDVSVWELFWWTFAGASLCIPEPGVEKDPSAMIEEIAQNKVSVIHFVPPMLAAFLDYVGRQKNLVSSLRLVFASGEALTPKHIESFTNFNGESETPKLINLYGPTEATVDVTYFDCAEFVGTRARIPLGKPIYNTKIFVLDKFFQQVPLGFFGEIFIGGTGVARGYHDRPELTEERFLVLESLYSGRLYRTGDIGRFGPDGLIEYAGRTDQQVKVRGFRIELQEVSTVIESLADVRSCVVLTGSVASSNDTLLAFVKVSEGVVTPEKLSLEASLRLPAHMVPGQFILLDDFPSLPNGKIDRKSLLQLAETSKASAIASVAPQDEVEAKLLAIWRDVLGRTDIGVTDNFFAIGGNSIHFVSILGKARQAGISFSFQDMFKHPTISELRPRISLVNVIPDEQRPQERFELLSPSDRAKCEVAFSDCEDAYPMTAMQEGLVFEKELYIAAAQYHDVFTYTIEGGIDGEIFKAAAQHVVNRNQIFRTSYHMSGFEKSIQVVHRNCPAQVSVDDLRNLSEAEKSEWLEKWLHNERTHLFQWEKPGLVRFHIQILSDTKYLYTLSQHNSALDGWSISLVHTELFNTYFDLLAGATLVKEAKKNYIRDYVKLETQALADTAQHEYWDSVLRSANHALLPVEKRPKIGERFTVKYYPVEISKTLSDALIDTAERLKVPVKSVLLAAHIKVLSVLGNTDDVLTGYEHSGRPEVDGAAEGTGVFLNTVPFRVQLRDESYSDLIKDVYATEGQMLPNRRLPMARMKERSGVKEVLFESVFNYTHFYRLKELKKHENFSLIEVEARGETEFALRAEFSRHFFGDNVKLNLHYHVDAFGENLISTAAQIYVTVLNEIVDDIQRKHQKIDFFDRDGIWAIAERGKTLVQDVVHADTDECLIVVNDAGYLQPVGAYGELAKVTNVEASKLTKSGRGYVLDSSIVRTGVIGRISFETNHFFERAKVSNDISTETDTTSDNVPLTQKSLGLADLIAENWSKLLHVPKETISLESNFFDLGGTSILAMKSVLELRGTVSLVQLLTNSTLGPLVRSLSIESEKNYLLYRLKQGIGDEVALVYFPYAGGNAINFRDVANELGSSWPQLSVYGIELPGHDYQDSCAENLVPLDQISDRLAKELNGLSFKRFIFWSHCVGAALCFDTVGKISDETRIERVFIGAKILGGAEADAQRADRMAGRDDDSVIKTLGDLSAGLNLDDIGSNSRHAIAAAFRHDAVVANRFLSQAQSDPRPKFRMPLVNVIAKDDPLTLDYVSQHERWEIFSKSLVLETLDSGGHFFCRTQPAAVAQLIMKYNQVK